MSYDLCPVGLLLMRATHDVNGQRSIVSCSVAMHLCHLLTAKSKGVTGKQGSNNPTRYKVPKPESGDRGRHMSQGEDNG
jgi:hypothetical protein